MSEDTSGFDLTRRRLLGGITATGAAAAATGVGTVAYLRDTETSSTNVQAGTLELAVSNSTHFKFQIIGGAPGNGSSAKTATTMSPTLSNTGSTPADHVEIDINVAMTEEDGDGDPNTGDSGPESDTSDGASNMGKWVEVDKFSYTADGSTTEYVMDGKRRDLPENPFHDTNDNGFIDLDDLDALSEPGESALDGFVPPEADGDGSGADTDFTLALGLASEMPNDYQGDILNGTVTVSLHQDSNQDNDIDQ